VTALSKTLDLPEDIERPSRPVSRSKNKRPAQASLAPHAAKRPAQASSALHAWPEISARLQAAPRFVLLSDFDGTLVELRDHPSDVRVTAKVASILAKLAARPNISVALVSGRRVKSLKKLLRVKGLGYFGLHGAERDNASATLSDEALLVLEEAKLATRKAVRPLRGIWLEDKGMTFAVHYRNATHAVARAARVALEKVLEPWKEDLHVIQGSSVWEVLPQEIPGKSGAVASVIADLPPGTPVIYIGDDGTDEHAFAVLPGQITIRVGEKRRTRARYYLQDPADVLLFLEKLAEI
jgi:trehalose 6-phosphate phosphatase